MSQPSDTPLARVRAWSSERGLNLAGVVDAESFDRSQPTGRRARDLRPDCETIVVLGSGGRSCWEHLQQELGPELEAPRDGHHPIDDWSGRTARALLDELGVRGGVVLPNDALSLNFVQLAEMAGFGTVSPVIHQLLHPEYGPWVSLRAALLLPGRPLGAGASGPIRGFEPCGSCNRPCVAACPTAVYSPGAAPRFSACAQWRVDGGCSDGCEVRRACPVGWTHRYAADEEAFRHTYSLFTMRRCARRGLWARVVAAFRGRPASQ